MMFGVKNVVACIALDPFAPLWLYERLKAIHVRHLGAIDVNHHAFDLLDRVHRAADNP